MVSVIFSGIPPPPVDRTGLIWFWDLNLSHKYYGIIGPMNFVIKIRYIKIYTVKFRIYFPATCIESWLLKQSYCITCNSGIDDSIQFFILTCWLNSYWIQLKSQHKITINVQKSVTCKIVTLKIVKTAAANITALLLILLLLILLLLLLLLLQLLFMLIKM
jgi:hypothetical protein